MFDILQKAGRGVKKFMSEKINTCKEILSLTEFWNLLEGCSSQQKLYAVWLRYYF